MTWREGLSVFDWQVAVELRRGERLEGRSRCLRAAMGLFARGPGALEVVAASVLAVVNGIL